LHQESVHMEWSWKVLADLLECFQPLLEVLEVRLEMTSRVPGIPEGGTFEVHRLLLGRSCILATMAHNWDILGLRQQSTVSSLVAC
jgi:hypothetical protein